MKRLMLIMGGLVVAMALAMTRANAAGWQERADWSRVFSEAGVSGTALIYDEAGSAWLFHDRARAERAYTPASTFKIFNALAALESKAINDEYEVIRWDGKKRQFEGWNRDHSLASGMRSSVVWFYQEMARRIGAARMQDFLDKAGYGNRDFSGEVDQFWLNNTLRISAHQQIDFLRRLADGTLPFSADVQETVRRITLLEDAPGWTMHAKTGWALKGAADGKTDLGWLVGWVERDGRRWFFAVNIDMPDSADPRKRMQIARKLLEGVGAFGTVP